ncbi:MAG: hypothetical protein JXR39_08660 [Marinilabiliaceae bacterium]|nr:hypothetical protein [Marinilabiliaceae bacterium]
MISTSEVADIITGLSFDKDSWIIEERFQSNTSLSFCVWRCKSNKVSHKRKLSPGCINWIIDIASKNNMTKKVTSPKVASTASKILQDNRFGKASKSVAGSALSQKEKKKK